MIGEDSPAPLHRSEPNRWQEVVDTSARLFYQRGYESTSVNDIANALGISKGGLYYYASSKEELLYVVIDQIHDLTTLWLQQNRGTDGDALDRLWSYFVGHVRLNTDHLHASTLIYRELRHLSKERRDDIVRVRDALQAHVRGLIDEAIANGLVRADTDVHLASIQMFSVANAIHQWYTPEGSHSAEEISHAVATFAVRAISRDTWDPPASPV